MDLEKTLRSLKHTQDEELLQQIETAYPADWDPERLFEKSYRNYLKQTAEASPRHRRRMLYQTIGIAACLLFVVGIGLGIYSRQERVERKPPQETTPVCDPAVTEAASLPATEPVVDITEAPSETPTERTTATSEPVAAPTMPEPETVAMETATTAMQQPDPTENPVATAQDGPAIDPYTSDTEPIPTDPTEPDSTSDPDVSIVDESLLPWFVIEEANGVTRIRSTEEVEPSPAEWVTYSVEAEQFTLTDVRHHSTSCEYRITAAETEQTLTVYQYERTAFVRLWDTELHAAVVFIHDHPGCAWTDANGKCGLLWDDGHYTFVVETAEENADILPILAKSIRS